MRALFLHQNMPGQFRWLAPALARQGTEVVFLTRRSDVDLEGVRRVTYTPRRSAGPQTHQYLRSYEEAVLHGQQVVRSCLELNANGFRPDIVVAHPGWGEALFIKDVFPNARLINYCEYYYHGRGADVGFDPEERTGIDTICRARARNAHLLLSLQSCDLGWSPTEWQRSRHPVPFLPKIAVVHDGVDTAAIRPDPGAAFTLPDGRTLTEADEVVTYVARNLEPYRGFPSFMRALPDLLRLRPNAQIIVVGSDATSYGPPPRDAANWREKLLQEVGPLDPARVHFVGHVARQPFLALLAVSKVHIYLTVPFVLSWSCLEAMASGCIVVGSRTPPVEEVIEDGRNGMLVDFFAPQEIAARAAEALAMAAADAPMRLRARETVQARYDLPRCLAEQIRLVRSLG